MCQINACHSVRVIGFPSGNSRSFDHSMYLDVILINMQHESSILVTDFGFSFYSHYSWIFSGDRKNTKVCLTRVIIVCSLVTAETSI